MKCKATHPAAEETSRPPAPPVAADARWQAQAGGSIAEALARLEWLLVLLALALVVLVYPLRLQDSWLRSLQEFWGGRSFWARLGREQIEPYLSFFFSPLLLKGVLAGIAMLGFMAVHLGRRLLDPVLGPGRQDADRAPDWGPWAWVSAAAFFGWLALGALWSPTPLLSGQAATWAVLYGAFIYLLLRRGLTTAEMTQAAAVLILIGVVAIAIVYLEALPLFGGKIFLFFYHFDEATEARNAYGSLLGHNTAASSYVLMTLFPALAFLLSARTRARRLLSGLYLAAALFAILILQSRAIWILLALLGLPALWFGLRARGLRRPRWAATLLFAMLALVLATQVIDRPWNHLFLRSNPLSRRLKAISMAGILDDARVRLDVIGIRHVIERPLLGQGLFAYQYVYPKWQGEYFLRYPDSRLNQTIDRSNWAHNEYLELTIDHGLIGLALLGWLLAEIAGRGWRRRRELAMPVRLMHQACGWSALGFSLHAAVDFPWHVPQLALPGILCLAAWGALRPAGQPARVPVVPGPAPAASPDRFRLVPFLRLLAAFVLMLLIPLATLPLLRTMRADTNYCQGNALINLIIKSGQKLSEQDKAEVLQDGIRKLKAALQENRAHYLAWQALGQAGLFLGHLYARQARLLPKTGALESEASGTLLDREAERLLKLGLRASQTAGEGLDFDRVYWLRAQLYNTLDSLRPGRGYQEKYIANLTLTLRYCAGMAVAAYELAEALAQGPHPDSARVLKLRRQVYRYNPTLCDQFYVQPAYALMRQKCYATAAHHWEEILQIDPRRSEWLCVTAVANMMAGNRKRGRQLIALAKATYPEQFGPRSGELQLAAAIEEDWPLLLQCLSSYHPASLEGWVQSRIQEDELQRRLGRPGPTHFPCPDAVAEKDWTTALLEQRPGVLLHYLNDPRSARLALQACLLKDSVPPVDFWIEAFYIDQTLGDRERARGDLDEIRKLKPDHAVLPDLERSLGDAPR